MCRRKQLITSCWSADRSDRPSFDSIVSTLTQLSKLEVDVSQFTQLEVKIDSNADTKTLSAAGSGALSATAASLSALLAGGGGAGGGGGASALHSLFTDASRPPWLIQATELHFDRRIGQGSSGEVWLGTFRGKTVAIKKMSPVTAAHTKEFVSELNVMCAMRHPNTVLFIGACVLPTPPHHMCIVMEYCERGNLHDVLSDKTQGKHLDFHLIMKILTEVALGMQYLHMNQPQPILHRDLKSLNILIDNDYNVKVSDFGLTAVCHALSLSLSLFLAAAYVRCCCPPCTYR